MNPIVWIIALISVIVLTSYITVLICNHEYNSSWQEITYTGNSVEPKNTYICRRCNNQAERNHHYCSNCGALMKNGVSYHCYSSKIDLLSKLEEQ